VEHHTVRALTAAIAIIEGKASGARLMIDWGDLHTGSAEFQQAIPRELGVEKLRALERMLKSD